jgi:hypothetical protein
MEESYNWRTDSVYKDWEKRVLFDASYTFDETVEICGVGKWKWQKPEWREQAKAVWLKYVARWNRDADHATFRSTAVDKTVGFAAICLLYAALPYKLLHDGVSDECSDVSVFVAQMANRMFFYEQGQHDGDFVDCFVLSEDLTGGPMFPPAYRQWITNLYQSASWWLSFLVFERTMRADNESMVPIELRAPVKWNKERL